MAFCKVCNCGEKIVFERRMSFPDNCPSCGRRIADFQTYGENDPIVAALMEANAKKRIMIHRDRRTLQNHFAAAQNMFSN